MKRIEDYGIYVHIPFCMRKCMYCDFYSVGARNIDWDRFVLALGREYKSIDMPAGCFPSLYIGGGTPSLAPVDVIERVRKMILFDVGEFTIEVNPDDVTDEKAKGWRNAGVNRISMGIQSLNNDELKFVGRRHNSEDALHAYDILAGYFDNISIDLMFGLPLQTIDSLNITIDGFLKMKPKHISAYSLMYEERTALTGLRDCGKLKEIAEEDSVEMFRLLTRRLAEAGYERYEISNYAQPGYRSHHNSNYWKGLPYVGLGPAAHSYDGIRTRRYNSASIDEYLRKWGRAATENGHKDDATIEEVLTDDELREEMILTRLRMKEGLDLKEYGRRFGDEELNKIMSKTSPFIKREELKMTISGRLKLTDKGVMISDEIISSLF